MREITAFLNIIHWNSEAGKAAKARTGTVHRL